MVVTLTDAPFKYAGYVTQWSDCWSNGAITYTNDYDCALKCKTSPCYPSGTLYTAAGTAVTQCQWYGTGELLSFNLFHTLR